MFNSYIIFGVDITAGLNQMIQHFNSSILCSDV